MMRKRKWLIAAGGLLLGGAGITVLMFLFVSVLISCDGPGQDCRLHELMTQQTIGDD
jgi:hypothetical protein